MAGDDEAVPDPRLPDPHDLARAEARANEIHLRLLVERAEDALQRASALETRAKLLRNVKPSDTQG